MAKRISAFTQLQKLTAQFEKQRQAIMKRAKAEAAPAVLKIVDQLEHYARDFPDIVRNAVSRFAGNGEVTAAPKRGRPAGKTVGPRATKPKPKAKPSKVSPAQVKAVFAQLGEKPTNNPAIAQATKLPPAVVSIALRQIRSDGKAKSQGLGRKTTWTAA